MTDERTAAGMRSGAPVLVTAAVAFAVVLVVLALQMRAGQDPALRAGRPRTPPPRRVLVRRVLERRVIVELPAHAVAPGPSASQQVAAAGAFEGGSPLTRTS